MTTRLLAAALLAGLAGTAQAQSAVTVYGNVDVNVSRTADKPAELGKGDYNRLGLKGAEDLGSGLKAIFQLEILYEPDTGAIGGVGRPLFQGESHVGLRGDFGALRAGHGLTPAHSATIAFEPWSYAPGRAGFATDVLVAGYTSDPLGPGATRNHLANAVFYDSPLLGGSFQLSSAIATRENPGGVLVGRGTAQSPQFTLQSEAAAHPVSLAGLYTRGPFAAMLAYERNAVDTRYYGAGVSYMAMPSLKLMATYSRQDQGYTMAANDTTSAWVLGANYALGAGRLLAGYGEKRPEGLEATRQFSLGYEHSLSKRTYLYVDAMNKRVGALNSHATVNFFDIGVHHKF